MIIYTYLLPEESSGNSNKRIISWGFAISILLAVVTFFISPIAVSTFFPEFENRTEVEKEFARLHYNNVVLEFNVELEVEK